MGFSINPSAGEPAEKTTNGNKHKQTMSAEQAMLVFMSNSHELIQGARNSILTLCTKLSADAWALLPERNEQGELVLDIKPEAAKQQARFQERPQVTMTQYVIGVDAVKELSDPGKLSVDPDQLFLLGSDGQRLSVNDKTVTYPDVYDAMCLMAVAVAQRLRDKALAEIDNEGGSSPAE